MNNDDEAKSLEEKLKGFDVDRHAGEVMAGPSVGHEIIEVDAAFFELFQKAQEMLSESTNSAAASFDTERWMREWIRKPQPALGGRPPVEMLATRDGVTAVLRVLGAFLSGSFL
ncbi:MAG: DUF2384 domain-containing protein [Betaproteobacteria bacterium]|nr:DUF2384 domain-containing protein [Betaproteobacteria bacterium]MBU6511755.1 DUF2384 domain-containing protein [Betaproteobacteria bacterium]MDE1954248.1 DUF2384 domain-containing protein [Betaproteobacteria bacterium]MDE2153297.1 DUF2384 domain-containing protein [Betaproteobacteria bacterium]